MTREDAYKFLQLYAEFVDTVDGIKINDLDAFRGKVELQFAGMNGQAIRRWFSPWDAAKMIEAHSGE